jgi:hypothetical protein
MCQMGKSNHAGRLLSARTAAGQVAAFDLLLPKGNILCQEPMICDGHIVCLDSG